MAAAKAGRKPGTFKKGHDSRRNVTKAGPGRPPDEFKALCQSLASRDLTVEAVTAILNDPTHTQFMAALKWATEQGYGKPMQAVELTGKDGGAVKTERVLRWGSVEIPL